MSSLAETRRLRSGSDAERFDDLDDDDRGVDTASWLAASDAGQAKCCLALLRVSGGGIDGMAWHEFGCCESVFPFNVLGVHERRKKERFESNLCQQYVVIIIVNTS